MSLVANKTADWGSEFGVSIALTDLAPRDIAKKVIDYMESQQDSLKYWEERLEFANRYEGGMSVGMYQRNLEDVKDKIDTIVRKYPEYLI